MNKSTKLILCGVVLVAVISISLLLLMPHNCKVSFDTNGGSIIESQTIKKGGHAVKPTNPTKSGFNFVEWTYLSNKYDFNSEVKENITLVAVWEKIGQKYTVSLEIDGLQKSIEVEEGKTISETQLVSLEKDGYEIEWYLDDKKIDIESTPITSKLNLTGKYVEAKTFEVKFDSDGGSGVNTQKIVENKQAKQPANPTKKGYIFDDWYLGNTKYDFNNKVTKSITLKAKWKEDANVKKYTVSFNSDGGSSVSSQTIVEGNKATKPADPTKAGYAFKEWQLNGTTYNFNNAVNKNITLKAVWQKQYTVSFNSNGGSGISNQTIVEGNKAIKPANPTKDGYKFKEWQLNGNAYDFNSTINGNISLNAVWTELEKYTVSFNSNGGSSVSSQTIVEGNKATIPANPTKEGHNFKEWQLNGNAYDFNSTVNGNISLNAIWVQKTYVIVKTNVDAYSPDVKLSVKENNANGQSVSFTNIKYGNTVVCTSNNPTVNKNDIDGITSLTVTLSGGTTVTATVVG